jgi:hypothetical protein
MTSSVYHQLESTPVSYTQFLQIQLLVTTDVILHEDFSAIMRTSWSIQRRNTFVLVFGNSALNSICSFKICPIMHAYLQSAGHPADYEFGRDALRVR